MANTTITQLPTITQVAANTWFETSDTGVSLKANGTQIIAALSQNSFNSFTTTTDTVTANLTARIGALSGIGGTIVTGNADTLTITIDTTAVFAAANAAPAAYTRANVAIAQTAVAFAAANTSQTEAVAAYGQANTGIAQTSVAFAAANAAQTEAVAAYGQANTANTRAYLTALKTGDTFTGDVTVNAAANLNMSMDTLFKPFGIYENVSISTSAAPANVNVDSLVSSVFYYSGNMNANVTVNIRGNATTRLDTSLAIGQSFSIALLLTNGSGAGNVYYPLVYQVDGAAVTPKWPLAMAPTTGHANSIDTYAFSVLKTAANVYSILGSQTQYG